MEQLVKNKTLRYILSTLLTIGNFLNGTNVSHDCCRFPSSLTGKYGLLESGYFFDVLRSNAPYLNFQAKGFELTYLEKVPEVKDTVHKQSLLHHACSAVVENFPESTDLYSEIGAITRCAKVCSGPLFGKLACVLFPTLTL